MHLLFLLYLALPAFFANMAPVLAEKYRLWPKLNIPIDFGKTFQGKRLFGDHKTLRGFVIGILIAMFVSAIQFILNRYGVIIFSALRNFFEFLAYGFLSGLGALVGDAVKSFFKRQFGIPSGGPFIPFDQVDYILGFLFFTSLLVDWSFRDGILLFGSALILNPLINLLSYLLGIKKTFW